MKNATESSTRVMLILPPTLVNFVDSLKNSLYTPGVSSTRQDVIRDTLWKLHRQMAAQTSHAKKPTPKKAAAK